ncbi:MAG TPA: hypothetical protein VLL25_13555 [Acidimicrobiales bacterium]|nr:hypothetical protein [Acidimicrobiales bacterium]
MRALWPPTESAQADYEALRAAAIAGTVLADAAASRFSRGGLAALIARPHAEPVFVAVLRGAPRVPWSPHADPRLEALAAGFGLLLACADDASTEPWVAAEATGL